MLKSKGNDKHAMLFLKSVIRTLGYRRINLKSDNEPALIALKNAIIESTPEVEIIPRESPEGDHQANGDAECAVREIKRMIRRISTSLEEKLGQRLPLDHPLRAWVPLFAAKSISNYRMGSDGLTPQIRLTGKPWRKESIAFGEKIYIKPVNTQELSLIHI